MAVLAAEGSCGPQCDFFRSLFSSAPTANREL